jgi:hypothetical protein
MSHTALDSQLLQMFEEPLHGSRGFDAHHYRTFQGRVKLSQGIAFVGKFLSTNSPVSVSTMAMVCCLACRSQPTIFISASFVPSLFGWIPQSLLGRCEADVVMTSATGDFTHNPALGVVDDRDLTPTIHPMPDRKLRSYSESAPTPRCHRNISMMN